ncbi:MAG TPA: hypothetical protein PKA58_20380 [Polyangium sp.]|jgi:hypothetical protein|nr:hypothetical protein [Polyangium sp.]
MSELQPESVVSGPQEYRFIPPDLIQLHLRGSFDGPEVEAHLDFVHRHAARCGGWVYALADLTQLERITESGRRRLTRVETPYPYKACALLGASFATRTIANMIVSAGKALAPQSFHFPVKFVNTYEQANAWFDELHRNAT